MLKFLPQWLARPYTLVAGCAICSGVVVGTVDDLRTMVARTAYSLFFTPPDPRTACIESYFDSLGAPVTGSYRIILTELVNDPDLTQTRSVDQTLRTLYGEDLDAAIQFESVPCAIYSTAGNAAQRARDAQTLARSLAERSQADVVIWGEVVARDAEMKLSMTHATDTAKAHYRVEQSRLTTDFGADLGALIAAKMLTLVNLAPSDSGTYLVPRMERVLALTTPLVEAPPSQMTGPDRGNLLFAHAAALFEIGTQSGEGAKLEAAVAAYKGALEETMRDLDPAGWAVTQNNLGNALLELGERELGTERLAEAVTAYTEALKETSREQDPMAWARTQNNLGNALSRLGEREGNKGKLEAAITAYGEALKERTRDRDPLAWAGTKNNLGTALSSLGKFEEGTARFEAAVAAYTEALKETPRAFAPLDWAMTQNNLGTALIILAERETGTVHLDAARAAFDEALKERTRDRVPLKWAATQINLAVVEIIAFDKDGDPAHLDKAIDHAKLAREVFVEEGAEGFIGSADAILSDIAKRRSP